MAKNLLTPEVITQRATEVFKDLSIDHSLGVVFEGMPVKFNEIIVVLHSRRKGNDYELYYNLYVFDQTSPGHHGSIYPPDPDNILGQFLNDRILGNLSSRCLKETTKDKKYKGKLLTNDDIKEMDATTHRKYMNTKSLSNFSTHYRIRLENLKASQYSSHDNIMSVQRLKNMGIELPEEGSKSIFPLLSGKVLKEIENHSRYVKIR
jgi:hypothetical protein